MSSDYAIGYIAGTKVSSVWLNCLLHLIYRDMPETLKILSGPYLHNNRNQLVKSFLEVSDANRLLMLDVDMYFTLDDVDKILAHEDKPIVTGVYWNIAPWEKRPQLVHVGCGFMLIQRKVLEEVPTPFSPIVLPDGFVAGEDVSFRQRAEEKGFITHIDGDIRLGHAKEYILGWDGFQYMFRDKEGLPDGLS